MKTHSLLLSMALAWATVAGMGASRQAQWKLVDEAVEKGLPRTAIEHLDPIYQAALADKAWGEAVKALGWKLALEADLEGDKPGERIRRLEAEMPKVPAAIRPLLESILAHWYWEFFQEHRWRFMRRTATVGKSGDDLMTWDLPRVYAEISRHFRVALAADRTLKNQPVGVFGALLEPGTVPDAYRPTLYDILAHEALAFYTSGEQAAAKPEDDFEVLATSPVLDPVEAFVRWQPAAEGAAAEAPALSAIRLYQELLRFHSGDADRSAFLDVDLARILWAGNIAVGEEKEERVRGALKTFSEVNGDHPLAALALYHWARKVRETGEPGRARELARRGQQAHPDSPGGTLCANLVAEIEARSLSIEAEGIWNRPWAPIRVRHRNVERVHFRLVRWAWDEFLDRRHNRPDNLNEKERDQVLARAPEHTWSKDLPPTADYKVRVTAVEVPEALKPGFYFLVASAESDFGKTQNQLSLAEVWVSDLALVLQPHETDIRGFVLEAESGQPVAGARIQGWYLDANRERVAVPETQTDAEGEFRLAVSRRQGCLIRATAKGQEVATSREFMASGRSAPVPASEQTLFFLDRALYRPGQTIQYKGICLRAAPEEENYKVLPGREVTVVFYDPNRKEIARQTRRANDYGAFSGSFTAPADRLRGRMRLQTVGGPAGVGWLNVEEYKRPKFHVALDAPESAPRLTDTVRITGRALGYTGAAVGQAQVEYRVVREVRMPWWWSAYSWRRPGPRGTPSQEIAHGRVQTDADGAFGIEFAALPDRAVPEADEPTFVFRVHVDVTEAAGETRSAERTVRVGYTALEARLEADEWLTQDAPVALRVRVSTLDEEPEVAEGVIRVHALKAPERVQRPPLASGGGWYPWVDPEPDESEPDLSDPNQWELGLVVLERGFTTDAEGRAAVAVTLGAGVYRAMLETQDRHGKRVTARLPLTVLAPQASALNAKIPSLLAAPHWSVEPGQTFEAVWGTGYQTGRAFVEIEHRGRLLARYWTPTNVTQVRLGQPVTEALRGGFTLRVVQVRENRAYLHTRLVEVPWSDRDLSLKWEHFTSKLEPGQRETWTLTIQRRAAPGGEAVADTIVPAVAELAATLYDASLDAYLPQSWPTGFNVFRRERQRAGFQFVNERRRLGVFAQDWPIRTTPVDWRYRSFPADLVAGGGNGPMLESLALPRRARGDARMMMRYGMAAAPKAAPLAMAAPAPAPSLMAGAVEADGMELAESAVARPQTAPGRPTEASAPEAGPGPDLDQVSARRNLNETAFFFPHLTSDSNGVVRLEFTLPEALTEWRFLGFAHDRDLRAGGISAKMVTAKDLMVQPNPPRFLREGDVLEFSVKLINTSDRPQKGKVRLALTDGMTDLPADARVGNTRPEQSFELEPRQSRAIAWRLTVPDGLTVLSYRAVAATEALSDGEEGLVPVLPRRIAVTESLSLPMRGAGTREFLFKALKDAERSGTLQHQALTVQMVSNPAWYAVLALPYLMEYPYECSEQVFNRYYANALARHVATSDPRIRRVFDQWKGTAALESPLTKNAELKGTLLEETPWLRDAQEESEARRNVGVLFDDNRLGDEMGRALQTLREAQRPDGAWSWFPGGPESDYITLYVLGGFGRLRHLGVQVPTDMAVRALERLDGWIDRQYREILKAKTAEDPHLTPLMVFSLYGRSFFLKDRPLSTLHREAADYFLAQGRQHWVKALGRHSQAQLALALLRFGDTTTPKAIVASLKERSVTDPELGRYWRDTEPSWWWYRAPIETQALMIEAFAEITGDAAAVEECQVWLLQQKRTQDWRTTKATADAVYALLLRGSNLLASTVPVEVDLGGVPVGPTVPRTGPATGRSSRPGTKPAGSDVAVEPGTGFYERRFAGSEVKPAMARVTVKKADDGVAWGSVHWQYLEDIERVAAHTGTPLKLAKALFVKRNTGRGPVLEPVRGALHVGDELVVRLELRVDRDMEFVQLKDQRGSGTEPVAVLSGYRYQDGLVYYESTRDAAMHFFIDYLPKGTYVFEYSTRIQHRGKYPVGVAAIQCMYAPEFNSHSASPVLEVE
ncbi:MAG TPA: alpha-2-macroglobulin family protein [Verrucomicrobiota bacterium]|nr:alpha-2-macroglobulin family protein [Verrucomicrobiota bacterium]HNU52121.1 alpha-2-macroglobulin family protein [Verrucomicrobiota bacterium]